MNQLDAIREKIRKLQQGANDDVDPIPEDGPERPARTIASAPKGAKIAKGVIEGEN